MTSRQADDYIGALCEVEFAEARYRASLDNLAAARAERNPLSVAALRQEAEVLEIDLAKSLQHACRLHLDYWQGRLAEMTNEVRAAAEVFGRYNRVACAAGVPGHNPAGAFCADIAALHFSAAVVIDIPIEGPDSELLITHRGAWRK